MAAHWAQDACFYHVYPLGMCGAPRRNDFVSPPEGRLAQLFDWIGHWQSLGITALYLGPVFESTVHGYDTADYYTVDRRLGDHALLRELVAALHRAGIRVILDGVFNHVGRHFWAFRDVQQHGPHSAYREWIAGLDFRKRSPAGDPFSYRPWRGAYDLVKLNLTHRPVREHLLGAVDKWIREYDIDGLRLDAANLVKADFLRQLGKFARSRKPDFWLMGEVVSGNYGRYVPGRGLDSVTNYNASPELVTSLNRHDYFQIARTLDWQFGPQGAYRGMPLYTFADNHDMNRVSTRLRRDAHLYPLHILLFTMPGVPSIYYGSEWGIRGRRSRHSDDPLRPALRYPDSTGMPHPALADTLRRLTALRRDLPALRHGDYRELYVQPEQFVFGRHIHDQAVVVALNASRRASAVRVWVPDLRGRRLHDVLNPGESFDVQGEHVTIAPIHANWGRVLVAAP
jgi:glycosidase